MLFIPSISISILSLLISCYALYRRGPQGPSGDRGERGQKGEIGDTGARGERGERGEKGEPSRQIERARIVTSKVENEARPTILSKEERRDQIAAKATEPDFETQVEQIRERLRDGSGLMAADPDAQHNQPDWRRRQAR